MGYKAKVRHICPTPKEFMHQATRKRLLVVVFVKKNAGRKPADFERNRAAMKGNRQTFFNFFPEGA
jgi:hypothetical protein